MKSSRLFVFLGSFAAAFVVLAIAYVLFVNSFCRGRMENDPWLPYVYWHKLRVAQETPSPKIVIMGGSASLFSIHSDVISQMTGMPVVNMAMHAGIPFYLYDSIAKQCVGPGDIVILPLEIQHYVTEEDGLFKDMALSTLFGMAPELQASLTFPLQVRLYLCYGYSWMRRLAKSSLSKQQFLRHESEIEFLKGAIERLKGDEWKNDSGTYSIRHCNNYGDMWIPFGLTKELVDEHYSAQVKPCFLQAYGRLKSVIEERGARMSLSFVNLNKHKINAPLVNTLSQQLRRHGISIIGSIEQFCFPDEYYYDTTYHMNQAGGEIYSIRLGSEICKFLGKIPKVTLRERPEAVPAAQYGEGLLKAQGWVPVRGLWKKERSFRWTTDTEVELQVLSAGEKKDKDLLRISVEPLIIPARGLNVQVVRIKSEKGVLLREFRLTSPKRQDLIVPVPIALIDKFKLTIKLELPDAISPKELGMNGDARKLGVKIYDVNWENGK